MKLKHNFNEIVLFRYCIGRCNKTQLLPWSTFNGEAMLAAQIPTTFIFPQILPCAPLQFGELRYTPYIPGRWKGALVRFCLALGSQVRCTTLHGYFKWWVQGEDINKNSAFKILVVIERWTRDHWTTATFSAHSQSSSHSAYTPLFTSVHLTRMSPERHNDMVLKILLNLLDVKIDI